MKKILSIFMVAVLSLNLLYQPCVAAGDKKEAVSAVKQESQNEKLKKFRRRVFRGIIDLLRK